MLDGAFRDARAAWAAARAEGSAAAAAATKAGALGVVEANRQGLELEAAAVMPLVGTARAVAEAFAGIGTHGKIAYYVHSALGRRLRVGTRSYYKAPPTDRTTASRGGVWERRRTSMLFERSETRTMTSPPPSFPWHIAFVLGREQRAASVGWEKLAVPWRCLAGCS